MILEENWLLNCREMLFNKLNSKIHQVRFDENDRRFHARPIICGSPTIISIPSIVEGPARPKAYYFKQMMKDLLSKNSKEIDNEFANRYVSYGDPRLPQVATGYAIQAVFFSYEW